MSKSKKKSSKADKEVSILRDLLWRLCSDAERVSKKYGTSEDGVLSDWTEWIDLRTSIANAKTKGGI